MSKSELESRCEEIHRLTMDVLERCNNCVEMCDSHLTADDLILVRHFMQLVQHTMCFASNFIQHKFFELAEEKGEQTS